MDMLYFQTVHISTKRINDDKANAEKEEIILHTNNKSKRSNL